MNIDELRELKVELERRMEYCPPDDAPPRAFEIAERSAIAAGERYDELAPAFALLDVVDGLAGRLDALEQAAKDQARNSNASAIAFNDRLNTWNTELNGLRDIISATLNRLAEIEKPPRVVLTPDGECVQDNGLLPAGAFDGDMKGGEA